MTLDYNSLLTALGLSGGCLAVTLVMTWSVARAQTFLLTWAIGVALIVAYVLLYGFYVAHPGPLLGAAAFALLLTGLSALVGAARQFRTGHPSLRLTLSTAVLSSIVPAAAMLLGFDGLSFIALNTIAALLLSATAGEYWAGRAEAPGPIVGLTVLYAVTAFGFVLCACVLIGDGRLVLGQAPQNWAEDVSLAISIAGMTGIGALSLALNHWRIAGKHRQEAMTDALTGLLNRRALFDRHGSTPMGRFAAVIVFDLDGFKSINDLHGHAVGDKVIRSFADLLAASTQRSFCAARLGGEEFAMVLPRCLPEQAEQLAERIRAAFAAREISTDDGTLACTVSAGIAFGSDDRPSFEAVLRQADKALYAAKRGGRNRTVTRNLRLVG